MEENIDRVKVIKKRCKRKKYTGKGHEDQRYLRYLNQEQIDKLKGISEDQAEPQIKEKKRFRFPTITGASPNPKKRRSHATDDGSDGSPDHNVCLPILEPEE